MYDRFSEYGKDHQAVRDRMVAEYKRKGYNETAAQILAEQKYQRQDKTLAAVAFGATIPLIIGTFGTMSVAKAITDAGGMAAVKYAIGENITTKLAELMTSTKMKEAAGSLATGAVKEAAGSLLKR